MTQSPVSLLNGPFSKAAAVQLKPELLQHLDSLFAFYHRQWWCHRQMFYHFKRCHALLNGLALLVMAAGLIAGSVLENSMVVACLAAVGTVVKGWNDFKKFSLKVDMCRFAYTSYAKTLIELRSYNPGQNTWPKSFAKTPQIRASPLHPQCNVDLKGPPHPESLQALSALLGVGEGRALTKTM